MKATERALFDPNREYMAQRRFVLAGESLDFNDPINKKGIETRRLRQMYEARLIMFDPRTAAEREAHAAAKAKALKAEGKAEGSKDTPAKKPAQAGAPAPAKPKGTGKAKRVNEGFGKFGVDNAAGERVLTGATKEEADAKIKELAG